MAPCFPPTSDRPMRAATSISSPPTFRCPSRRYTRAGRQSAMSAEIVETEIKHRGWSTSLIATIRLPDGTTITRSIEDHGDAVAVLPYDPVRRTAILVQQMRAPALYAAKHVHVLEAVAGRIDDGEDAETCARREA